jgi:hypothetical protein
VARKLLDVDTLVTFAEKLQDTEEEADSLSVKVADAELSMVDSVEGERVRIGLIVSVVVDERFFDSV